MQDRAVRGSVARMVGDCSSCSSTLDDLLGLSLSPLHHCDRHDAVHTPPLRRCCLGSPSARRPIHWQPPSPPFHRRHHPRPRSLLPSHCSSLSDCWCRYHRRQPHPWRRRSRQVPFPFSRPRHPFSNVSINLSVDDWLQPAQLSLPHQRQHRRQRPRSLWMRQQLRNWVRPPGQHHRRQPCQLLHLHS